MMMTGAAKRILKYINGTKKLCLALCMDEIGLIKKCVDVSYAVHYDCSGQTGENITFGSS